MSIKDAKRQYLYLRKDINCNILNKEALEQLIKICKEHQATLIAVSKTYSSDEIYEVYNSGIRDFGENRVQEMLPKQATLPTDIRWHLIGHLQSNKVKYIAPFIAMIHSVDSPGLAATIHQQALKNNRTIDILLQVHIATEEHKFGFSESEIEKFLEHIESAPLNGIRIRGLMGMATFTDNQSQIKNEFKALKSLHNHIKERFFSNNSTFDTLSMGMSGDYLLALEEGSNMLRIGSLIFGTRTAK
jgi:PLP dependent protein